MKKRWWFVLLIVFFGFLFFAGDDEVLIGEDSDSSNESNISSPNKDYYDNLSEEIVDFSNESSNYYSDLKQECIELYNNTSDQNLPALDCCLSDVYTMEKYGYLEMDFEINKSGKCPEGFEGVVSSCLWGGSVPFCVPEGDRRFMNPVSYTNMNENNSL
jgi:hypothetical protein